jgi:hypothetical protein
MLSATVRIEHNDPLPPGAVWAEELLVQQLRTRGIEPAKPHSDRTCACSSPAPTIQPSMISSPAGSWHTLSSCRRAPSPLRWQPCPMSRLFSSPDRMPAGSPKPCLS